MQTFENTLFDLLNRDLSEIVLPGLVLFVIALVFCRFIVFVLSKSFEACCDWLEYKLAGRKARNASLIPRNKKNQSVQSKTNNAASTTAKKTTNLNSSRKGRIIDAHNVLRRNAEAYTNKHKN